MEATFAVEDLVNMKRVRLQKLCKTVGIKANGKTTQLVEGLKEYAKMHFVKQSGHGPAVAEETHAVDQNVKQVLTPQQVEEKETNSYKQNVLEKLDNKVKEKLPKSCKIPRFVAQGVSIPATTTPGSNTKKGAKDWTKIHEAQFAKMDSIDVYLAKKRKRREDMECTIKKTKTARSDTKVDTPAAEKQPRRASNARNSHGRKSLGKSATKAFNPSVTALSKSATFVFDKNPKSIVFNDGTKNVTIPAKDGKSRLKSPKIFKAATLGFSFSATSGENRPKTPSVSRKSLATTPYRFSLGVINNTPGAIPTPRKKFDLQASLAKPLSYKPYTGKLQPVSQDKNEENKNPTKRVKIVDHKVDIKSVKVSTRDQRRNKATRNRVDKRSEAMSRRRRLVH